MKLKTSTLWALPPAGFAGGWMSFEILYLPFLFQGLLASLALGLASAVLSWPIVLRARRLQMPMVLQVLAALTAPAFVAGFALATFANIKLAESRFSTIVGILSPIREGVASTQGLLGRPSSSLADLPESLFSYCRRSEFEFTPATFAPTALPATLEYRYSGGAFRTVFVGALYRSATPKWIWYDRLTGVQLVPMADHVCWRDWQGASFDGCARFDW